MNAGMQAIKAAAKPSESSFGCGLQIPGGPASALSTSNQIQSSPLCSTNASLHVQAL